MTETQRIRALAQLAGQACCDICDRALGENEHVKRRTACGIMDFCLECYGDVYGADALSEAFRHASFARSMAAAKTPREQQLVMLAAVWGGR